MKRKIISPAVWRSLKPYRAMITLVELETPELGAWQIYEWELWNGSMFIAKGSLPYGNNYILVDDVVDQLEYEYISKHEMIPAEDTRDEAYGL